MQFVFVLGCKKPEEIRNGGRRNGKGRNVQSIGRVLWRLTRWTEPGTIEYRSEIGYLVREFEAEAERKKVEMKNRSEGAKEERAASKRPFLTRLFDRRRTSR